MTYLILNHNQAQYRSDEVFDHSQVQLVDRVLPGLGLVHDADELIWEGQGLTIDLLLTKVQDTFPEKLDPKEAEDEEEGVHGGRKECPYQDFGVNL